MKFNKLKYYLVNCFLLLIPIFVWNIIFSPYLPEYFTDSDIWNSIPNTILWLENISMIIVFILTLLMPLKIKTPFQKIGLIFYLVGLLIYLIAWREIILYPNGNWVSSIFGFTSLAYTPFLLLVSIGLIGRQSFLKIRHHRILYFASVIVFVVFHTWHAALVYLHAY